MFDLKITGGTIADGTGAAPRVEDVAIRDGVIVEQGPSVAGAAARTLDAAGYDFTIVSEGVAREGIRETGTRPGRVVRGAR